MSEQIVAIDDARFVPLIVTMPGVDLITGIVTVAGVVLAMASTMLLMDCSIEHAMLAMCCPLFLARGVAVVISHRKRSGRGQPRRGPLRQRGHPVLGPRMARHGQRAERTAQCSSSRAADAVRCSDFNPSTGSGIGIG